MTETAFEFEKKIKKNDTYSLFLDISYFHEKFVLLIDVSGVGTREEISFCRIFERHFIFS